MFSRRTTASSVVFVLVGSWAGDALAADDDLALDLGGTALELRRVQKGTFTQGSPAAEATRESDENQRQVTISRAFWLGKVPITRAQFSRFVSETRHVTEAQKGQSGGWGWDAKLGMVTQRKDFSWRNPGFPQKDEDPVVLVTFGDANAFTAWASRKSGRRVRLPTEAEWEYAARAGTTTPWFGATKEEDVLALGWFKTNSGSTTHPVGLRKPNAFGLFDMAGNVFEWCRDVYAPYPPGDATDPENTTNPTPDPERRVLRGGSWLKEPKRARSAARSKNTPGSRNADNGFRVAVDDDAALGPTPTGVPTGDFAPAAPLGMGATAAPGADASPVATFAPPAHSSEGAGWSLFAAPAAGAAAAIAWVLARRKKTPPNALGMTTRAQNDGFWLRAPRLPTGTRVRYACIVNGVEVSDVVPVDGAEETFVYTGSEPSAIRITETVQAPIPSYRSSQPPAPISVATPFGSVTGPVAPRAPVPSERSPGSSVGSLVASSRRSNPPPVPSERSSKTSAGSLVAAPRRSNPPPLPSERPSSATSAGSLVAAPRRSNPPPLPSERPSSATSAGSIPAAPRRSAPPPLPPKRASVPTPPLPPAVPPSTSDDSSFAGFPRAY
jgi:formylglycine-generating enzyme required for sulfatase activity